MHLHIMSFTNGTSFSTRPATTFPFFFVYENGCKCLLKITFDFIYISINFMKNIIKFCTINSIKERKYFFPVIFFWFFLLHEEKYAYHRWNINSIYAKVVNLKTFIIRIDRNFSYNSVLNSDFFSLKGGILHIL